MGIIISMASGGWPLCRLSHPGDDENGIIHVLIDMYLWFSTFVQRVIRDRRRPLDLEKAMSAGSCDSRVGNFDKNILPSLRNNLAVIHEIGDGEECNESSLIIMIRIKG